MCWPGGRIGMANWTPNGFVGQLFKLLGGYLPPPAGVRSPALWGTGARLRELFPGRVIEATPRVFNFRYRSAEHLTEVFRTFYGPVHKAFLALEADRQAALERDMQALMASFDVGGGGPACGRVRVSPGDRPGLTAKATTRRRHSNAGHGRRISAPRSSRRNPPWTERRPRPNAALGRAPRLAVRWSAPLPVRAWGLPSSST